MIEHDLNTAREYSLSGLPLTLASLFREVAQARQRCQRFFLSIGASSVVTEPIKAPISDRSSSRDGMSIMSATYPLISF